jgi:drug/metabolite transporter (DMT)-like permease
MTTRAWRSDWALFVALGIMWGSSYLFIKLAIDSFGTFTLISLRLATGTVLLWAVLKASGIALPRDRRLYGHLVLMACVNIALPFTLITWAEQSVESALAAILTAAVPIFVIVIAPVFLPEEPIRVNGVVGLVVGFIGIVVLVSPGLADVGGDLSGELALVGAALVYAIGAVYNRRIVRAVPPLIPATLQVTFAFLLVTVLAFILERPFESRPDLEAIFSVVWLGVFGSGLAYLCYFRLITRWGATRTSLVAYLLPVVGIILGLVVLSEPVDARIIVGTALVIAGVALVNSRWGRRRLFSVAAPIEPA